MAIPFRLKWMVMWLGCLLAVPVTSQSYAQLRVQHVARTAVVAGETVGLFVTWEGDVPLSGLRVDAPAGWTLEAVRVPDPEHLQRARPAAVRPESGDTWRVDTSNMRLVRGGSVFLRLRAGQAGKATVRVVPSVVRRGERQDREEDAVDAALQVQSRPVRSTNHSLRLVRNEDPVPGYLIRRTLLQASWTASMWMRTAHADGVLWSTWSGDEKMGYPFELEIDPTGRLAAYTGNGQRHYAMRSGFPVADGAWHHVILSRDAENGRMRLLVDGLPQDSLSLPASVPGPWRSGTLKVGARAGSDVEVASFDGEVDELHLYDRVLGSAEIMQLGRRGRTTGRPASWSVRFERSGDAASDRDDGELDILPSLLSFRVGPTDVRIEVEDEGLRLSFAPGEEGATRFLIERSLDGVSFQRVATLIPLADESRLAWMDRAVPQGVMHYRVIPVYPDGPGEGTPAIKAGLGMQGDLSSVILEGNFPNPFNPTTTIRFEVLEPQSIRVSVWDLSGQMVASLVDGHHAPGRYEVGFQAESLPTGTYFVRLESETGIQTHQMILMK